MNKRQWFFSSHLRLATSLIRFVFIFSVAFYLPVQEVGIYGLLVATVAFATFLVGFDFYTYANREILNKSRFDAFGLLKTQSFVHLASYFIIVPFAWLVIQLDIYPAEFWWVLLVIVPLEHFGIEIERVLVILKLGALASVIFFLRQGASPVITLFIFQYFQELRSLVSIVIIWLIVNLVALFVGLMFLLKQIGWHKKQKTNWRWIRNGMKTSLVFFVSTLVLREIFLLDKQYIAAFSTEELLGVYVLFISISNGMTIMINSLSHIFIYPDLLASVSSKNLLEFRALTRKLTFVTLISVFLITIVALAITPLLISNLLPEIYFENYNYFPMALLAIGLYNIALIPHFPLYAMGADKSLLISTISTGLVFALSLLLLQGLETIFSVLTSLSLAFCVLFLGKMISLSFAFKNLEIRHNIVEKK